MNYIKNTVIKIDKDWITDFTFDFSSEIAVIDTQTVTADTGITIVTSSIVNSNQVVVRIAGGAVSTKYAVTVSATSSNGEKRDMTVLFLMT